MSIEEAAPPVPVIYNRAITELTQGRAHLEVARRSLELSLDISRRLGRPPQGVPIAELERVLAQLEEAESVLWESIP